MARDPTRIDHLLSVLETYWRQYPDLRLGQIVGNFAKGDPYYMEDEALIEMLQRASTEKPAPGQTKLS